MSDLNIGKVIIDQTKTSQVTVNYADTSKPDTSTITSNRTQMTAIVDSISTAFEVSKTYYFDADGGLVTTNQGYGTLGTTDSDGVLTVAHSTPSLALTAPSAGTKYEFEESFNVTWTSSNITLVNVILESESGGSKTYSDVTASLGTLAVAISESDGFSINETVYIYIENTHQTLEDSVQVASIATLTMTTPVLTGGVEGNITGTHNGGTGFFVQVQYRTSSPEGAWTTFENNVTVESDNTWSATGTVASADTYDFRARDTVDPDGFIQVDDVDVASGEVMIDDFESYTVGSNIGAPWSSAALVWKCNNSYSSKAGEYGANDIQNDLVSRDFPDQPLNLTGKKISMKVRKDAGVTVSNHWFYVRNSLGQNVAQLEVNSPTGYSDSAWTTLEWTLTAISGQNLNTCKSIALSWRTTSYMGRIYIDDLKII